MKQTQILMSKTEILENFPFYAEAGRTSRQMLEDAASAVKLRPGDFYFFEGDSCHQIALLGSGSIRVYKQGASGREITLYHVGAGETCILTASCVLAGMTYPACAIAELETEAVVFPAATFRNWVARDERVRQFVFKTLASRMSTVMALVEEIAFNRLDSRLAHYLRQSFANEGRPVRVLHATHEKIAAELGSAREVISRLLKEFERTGAIKLTRGRITLNDAGSLQRYLERS